MTNMLAKDFTERNWIIASDPEKYGLEFYLCLSNRDKRIWSLCRSQCIRFESLEEAMQYLENNPLPEPMVEERRIKFIKLPEISFKGITHSSIGC